MAKSDASASRSPVAGYFVGVGFLILASVFLLGKSSVEIPLTEQPPVRAEQIMPGAFRVALADPPMVNIGTYDQRCNDCHGLFENTRPEYRELTQHTNIILDHGINDGCLNCHDKGDREKLTLRGGGTVGFDQVAQLCAQCHGPIYRDWQKGSHGKTIGYWDTDLGEATKLTCSQCHDPHSPSFKPMPPLPGPHTLRMGKHYADHGDLVDDKNPLQRWRLDEHAESGSAEQGGDH